MSGCANSAAGPDDPADRPSGNRISTGEALPVSRRGQSFQPGAQSMPTIRPLLPMKPSVHRKTAIGERLRRALDRCDFVSQRTQEEHHLVLLGHDSAIVAGGPVTIVLTPRIIDAEFPATKLFRLAVKEVDEGNLARSNGFLAVIRVPTEKVAIVAGGNLCFHSSDGKRLQT